VAGYEKSTEKKLILSVDETAEIGSEQDMRTECAKSVQKADSGCRV
jgi:hypothetical protein